eukprot:1924902-Rhodomonas_salina.3
MSGTGIAHDATRRNSSLCARYAMSATVMAYRPALLLRDVRSAPLRSYGKSGTDDGSATECPILSRRLLRNASYSLCGCYGIPGTDAAYGATRMRTMYRRGSCTTTNRLPA